MTAKFKERTFTAARRTNDWNKIALLDSYRYLFKYRFIVIIKRDVLKFKEWQDISLRWMADVFHILLQWKWNMVIISEYVLQMRWWMLIRCIFMDISFMLQHPMEMKYYQTELWKKTQVCKPAFCQVGCTLWLRRHKTFEVESVFLSTFPAWRRFTAS